MAADDTMEEPTQAQASQPKNSQQSINATDLEFLNDVSIVISIEVGRTRIKLRDLLRLKKDAIIELDKQASEPVDIFANEKLIAKGNIITVNGKYCVRLVSLPDANNKSGGG